VHDVIKLCLHCENSLLVPPSCFQCLALSCFHACFCVMSHSSESQFLTLLTSSYIETRKMPFHVIQQLVQQLSLSSPAAWRDFAIHTDTEGSSNFTSCHYHLMAVVSAIPFINSSSQFCHLWHPVMDHG